MFAGAAQQGDADGPPLSGGPLNQAGVRTLHIKSDEAGWRLPRMHATGQEGISMRWIILPALAGALIILGAAPEAFCQPTLEAFDGSFRLQTGEVITGGYMVEGGQGRYVYLDTEGLDKGGGFEPVSDTVLRSIGLLGSENTEIEFIADVDGEFDSLVWREPGNAANESILTGRGP